MIAARAPPFTAGGLTARSRRHGRVPPIRAYNESGGDPIQRFFFESPWLLIPTLVVVQVILIKIWSGNRTQRRRRIMLAGFALCVLLPILQAVVVTHREQVEQVCQALVSATQNGDMAEIGRNVSPNFQSGDIDRDRFLDGVEKALTQTKVENANLRNVEIEIHDDGSATAQFTVTCRLATRETLLPNQVSAWTVRFEHVDGKWLMIEANPRPTPLFPFSRLDDLIR